MPVRRGAGLSRGPAPCDGSAALLVKTWVAACSVSPGQVGCSGRASEWAKALKGSSPAVRPWPPESALCPR